MRAGRRTDPAVHQSWPQMMSRTDARNKTTLELFIGLTSFPKPGKGRGEAMRTSQPTSRRNGKSRLPDRSEHPGTDLPKSGGKSLTLSLARGANNVTRATELGKAVARRGNIRAGKKRTATPAQAEDLSTGGCVFTSQCVPGWQAVGRRLLVVVKIAAGDCERRGRGGKAGGAGRAGVRLRLNSCCAAG